MEREDALFEDTSTDEIVKTSLGGFKAEYNQDSWDSLAKKLDFAEHESEPLIVQSKFDKVVSNSLKGITRKYDAATWPKLAARLEAEEKYLKHYYRAKTIEALLFCFLILTLYQFIKSGQLTKPVLGNKPHETASVNKSNTTTEISSADLQSPVAIQNNKLTAPHPANAESLSPEATSLTRMIDQNIDPQSANRELFHFAAISPSINENPALVANSSSIGLGDKINRYILPRSSEYIVEPVDHNLIEMPFTKAFDIAETLTKSILGTWKLGMYTHSDYNQIYLPDQYLLVYGVKSPLYFAKTVKSIGYGAGFKAHYIKKRIGGEIGLGYSKRSYAPNRKYYLDPFWNINFKRIEYDIIEMPISLKYTSKGNTRLKSYALVGVNANFIAKAIYDVLPEIKQVRTSTDLQLTVEQNFIKNRVEDQFTILDKRRALLYGHGSLGLEWKVNPTMDIYSQLTYGQRVLTEQFGPNWDQFRSLSLELGVKTSIK